jgi:hypothetical protein
VVGPAAGARRLTRDLVARQVSDDGRQRHAREPTPWRFGTRPGARHKDVGRSD